MDKFVGLEPAQQMLSRREIAKLFSHLGLHMDAMRDAIERKGEPHHELSICHRHLSEAIGELREYLTT